MEIIRMRTMQTELSHFQLERVDTGDEYIFLYYHTPVVIWLNGTPVNAGSGAWIIYNKHDHQKFYCKGEVLHDWFHLSGNMDELMQKCGLRYNTIYYAPSMSYITAILEQIEMEWIRKAPFNDAIIDNLISALFLRLAQQNANTEPRIGENQLSALLHVRSQIHLQFDKPWKVEDMAAMLSISPPQFYRLYRQVFGLTPKADLIEERIQRAKQYLLYRNDSLPQIAEAVGFTNEYSFLRAFKSRIGVTPAKYRAMWRTREDQMQINIDVKNPK